MGNVSPAYKECFCIRYLSNTLTAGNMAGLWCCDYWEVIMKSYSGKFHCRSFIRSQSVGIFRPAEKVCYSHYIFSTCVQKKTSNVQCIIFV